MKTGYGRLGWWLTAAIASLLVLPQLMHPGLYVDGLLYAAISRNLAEGLGSMWSPFFSETLFPQFYEHPPLAFWLQSLTYWVLGDHWWVDKLYGLVLLAGCLLLIGRIAYRGLGVHWIPAVGFLLIPLIWWSYSNNMLENTVTLFVLLSVWAQFKYTRNQNKYWLVIAGLALVGGFLAKGPVALFPLAFLPIENWLVNGKRIYHKLQAPGIILGVFMLVLLLLLIFPGPREALSRYWDQQVWNSLNGIRRDGSRWGTALHLLQQLIPLLLLYALGIWLNRAPEQRINIRYSLRWVLLALCGTIPIFISTKINIHYFIPAMPFYALALAPLFRDSMFAYLQEKFHLRRFRYSGRTLVVLFFAFTIILLFNQTGQPKRDQETIADLTLIAAELPKKAVVGLTEEIHSLWSLHANAYRFHHLSLAMDSQYPYVISTQMKLEGCQLLTPANKRFFLHARDEAP